MLDIPNSVRRRATACIVVRVHWLMRSPFHAVCVHPLAVMPPPHQRHADLLSACPLLDLKATKVCITYAQGLEARGPLDRPAGCCYAPAVAWACTDAPPPLTVTTFLPWDCPPGQPSSDIYSPGHVRLRLLDVALLALPYGGEEHGQPQDWHVLWEGLACGAVPILSADSIIYK